MSQGDLIDRLRSLGINITSVWDLVNTGTLDYTSGIPVLLEFLPLATDRKEREGIVRALTIRQGSRLAFDPMVEAFKREPDDSVRWAIGSALGVLATKSTVAVLVSLIAESKFGSSREMLFNAIGRLKPPEAVELLVALLVDESVANHAAAALARYKLPEYKEVLERFSVGRPTWVRNAVKKALG